MRGSCLKEKHEIPIELRSWREIAGYLNVSVRTAQKWEKERGLPVRREVGISRGSVSALVGDLDVWKRSGAFADVLPANDPVSRGIPTAENRDDWLGTPQGTTGPVAGANPCSTADNQSLLVGSSSSNSDLSLLSFARRGKVVLSQPWVQMAIALEIGVLAAYLIFGAERAGSPAEWKIANNALVVSDDRGIELWEHPFDKPLDGQRYLHENNHLLMNHAWFGDLEGDGSIETLFVEQMAGESCALICFSEIGREKWRFVPRFPTDGSVKANTRNTEDRVPNKSGPVDNPDSPLIIRSFRVAKLHRNRPNSIIAVSQMLVNPPVEVALLSFAGKLQGAYWHDGLIGHPYALEVADLDHNGVDEIYLGGENAQQQRATLVVLDPDHMNAMATGADSPAFPSVKETARVLFPRSCINRAFESKNHVSRVLLNRDSVTVDVVETEDRHSPSILYDLDARLSLKRFTWSEVFLGRHAQLAKEKKLDHVLTAREESEMEQIVVLRP